MYLFLSHAWNLSIFIIARVELNCTKYMRYEVEFNSSRAKLYKVYEVLAIV